MINRNTSNLTNTQLRSMGLAMLAILSAAFPVVGDDSPTKLARTPVPVDGVVERFVHSPKGPYEGLLVLRGNQLAQVTFPAQFSDDITASIKVGDSVAVVGIAEEQKGDHPVFKAQNLTTTSGKNITIPAKPAKPHPKPEAANAEVGKLTKLEGVVRYLNYARHGEVNGVVLDNGAFIHLHPDGARELRVKVGDSISAEGHVTTMDDETVVLEHPKSVNGAPAPHKNKKPKPKAAN